MRISYRVSRQRQRQPALSSDTEYALRTTALVTLLTDFGARDPFVGVMKGVILSLCPGARLVDLTHEVTPGDLQAGALALRWAAPYFPAGTVHLGVVDPGVGGSRRPLVLRTPDACFVGPDNGFLWPAASRNGEPEAWEIDLSRWDRPISATFHGRDVFAPAAARLAAGEAPEAFCRPAESPIRLDWPAPAWRGTTLHGVVLYVDRFGNAITNLSPAALGTLFQGELLFEVAGQAIRGPSAYYGAAPPGRPVVVLGSAGLYEVAINQGSAAAALGIGAGSPVTARAAGSSFTTAKEG